MVVKKKAVVKKASIYDDMIGIMVQSAEDVGVAIIPFDEHSKTLRGVPIPPLCLRWLINSNVWPVGRMTSSAGDPKTFKSTFAHQLMSWFAMAGGMGQVIDTEDKQSGETLEAMVRSSGIDIEDLRNRFTISSVFSMEQWQAIILNQSDGLRKKFKEPKNCKVPIINVIDSLTGANSEAGTDELVENEGGVAASRVGQQNAKALYQFLRDNSRRVIGATKENPTADRWPVTLHTVSHQRVRGDGFAGKERSGGVGPDFYTSLDLVFSKGGTSSYNASKADVPGAGKFGRIIKIQVRYSSLGPDGRDQFIAVPVLSDTITHPVTGRNQTRVYYDWYAADTHFLGKNYNKIKSVFHMESKFVKGSGEWAKSDTLGIKEFVRARDFGYALQCNPEVMELISNALGITHREEVFYLPGISGKLQQIEEGVPVDCIVDEDETTDE